MKKWTSVFGKVIMCICEIVVGILLLLDPLGFTAGIIKVAGALLLLSGAYSVFRYFRTDPVEAQKEQGLVNGLCYISCGLFCVFYTQWFLTTFPLLTVIYGVIILLTGLMRVQWAVDMLRMKKEQWYMAAIGAFVSLALAGFILFNPFSSTVFLWRFVAVSLIIGAVIDLLVLVFINQNLKQN
ncbi:MAG TPA: hypothetical protein DCZ23_02365, partial [Lachnospiraceae bacterium]|nr:hypothetical protein [Lachnospiraceae bacterium]